MKNLWLAAIVAAQLLAQVPRPRLANELLALPDGYTVGYNTAGPTTLYSAPGVSGSPFSNSSTRRAWPVMVGCTAHNLLVYVDATQPSDGTLVFTLMDTGTSPAGVPVSTGVSVTVSAANSPGLVADAVDTYLALAGHFLTMQLVNNSTSAVSAPVVLWAVLCDP